MAQNRPFNLALRSVLGSLALVIACNFNCSNIDKTNQIYQSRINTVANTAGLIAFWDFINTKGEVWHSHHDSSSTERSYPLYLKRIGDQEDYSIANWPYADSSSMVQFNQTGPFGHAIRFNQGYLYGAVPRNQFEGTALDLHGKKPFTIMAWVKFIGKRHMVTGIWDEGGWHKYAGRRQVALFAGLFKQKGVIAHISATGAASYPQSTIDGAQYARLRAIDGQAFEDHQWVAMAMTYDPDKKEVIAWLNGKMTTLSLTDPVTQDVYHYPEIQSANPFRFEYPIYSPLAFLLKYNYEGTINNGLNEHRLFVDLEEEQLIYEQDRHVTENTKDRYRIRFDITRNGKSILQKPIQTEVTNGQKIPLHLATPTSFQDEVWTSLEMLSDDQWIPVGTSLKRELLGGAPFTFGRALGLASEELDHGSQLFLDGVAVFNRVLSERELMELSF